MLKYPHDRTDGYVLLELNGKYFVPRFTRCDKGNNFQSYKKHWLAWRALLKSKFGKKFEPCNMSNKNVYWSA